MCVYTASHEMCHSRNQADIVKFLVLDIAVNEFINCESIICLFLPFSSLALHSYSIKRKKSRKVDLIFMVVTIEKLPDEKERILLLGKEMKRR